MIWTLASNTVSEFPLNRSVFPGVSALLIVERLFANVSIQIWLMDLHFFTLIIGVLALTCSSECLTELLACCCVLVLFEGYEL